MATGGSGECSTSREYARERMNHGRLRCDTCARVARRLHMICVCTVCREIELWYDREYPGYRMLPRVFVRCRGGGGDEGGALLRRPRDQDPGLLGERPEAPGPDRLPTDPGEPDALLRALRPPRVHPLPRLPGRSDQGVLPQLQRVSLARK